MSSNRSRTDRNADCGIVVCGGGPAGIGPIVCAAQTRRLRRLLDLGLVVVESTGALGSGSMSHYRVGSNSLGIAFLECLDRLAEIEAFARVRRHPASLELLAWSQATPPLRVVGAYLEQLGTAVAQVLGAHPRCSVLRETAVREIQLLSSGGVTVFADDSAGRPLAFTARRAVVTLGGVPPARLAATELLPGLTLVPFAMKLVHASALVDMRVGVSRELQTAVRASGRVTIVGGSHSGWSAAWLLLNAREFAAADGGPPEITLIHRGRIRLFYNDAVDARADGYEFEPEFDVCPLTGRVHRYGGLRGDARALARAVLRGEPGAPNIRLVEQAERVTVVEALAEAGLVVAATGYRPRLPRLVAADGSSLELAYSSGGAVTTAKAELVRVDGTPIPELIAYGLGAGLAVSPLVGGERSYPTADGVWLYQNDVGAIALGSLLREPVPTSVSTAAARC